MLIARTAVLALAVLAVKRVYGFDPSGSFVKMAVADGRIEALAGRGGRGTKLPRRYGAGLRRTLNAASRVLDTLALRGLDQEVIDGRLRLRADRAGDRVAYQGVPCTRTAVRLGTYPGRRPLGVVTRGRPRGALARLLRWAAHSRTARRVISNRYVELGQ